mgnify:CR=1 FL=1
MPKPVNAQGDVTDPEIDPDGVLHPSQGGGVQVDLKEDEGKVTSPPADGKGKETPATPPDRSAEERRWKALESQVAATRRINEDLRKQVTTLNERLQKPAALPSGDSGAAVLPKGTAQETIDKYDQLVEGGKWQEAVRLLAREEYRTSRSVEDAQEQVRHIEERRLTALERSKQKVEGLYPTLHRDTGDTESPETQLFNEAVSELSQQDEQFLHDPYAPELAMRRMEELAQERSIPLTRSTLKSSTVASSSARRGQTSLPVSRGPGGATTYSLTPEQKVWADTYLSNLPEADRYKHYARYAKAAETTGGVET